MSQICHISTFSPTQCGIATFTEDLIESLNGFVALRVRMLHETDHLLEGFFKTIAINDSNSYDIAINAINNSSVEIVSLQHEFGIFGGSDGEYVHQLLNGITKPIVTTLHTVNATLSEPRKKILAEIISRSSHVVVQSEESREFIFTAFGESCGRISVIRHGIPEVVFELPENNSIRRYLSTPLLFVSAGHLRPAKGYDIALKALALYRSQNPRFKYLILGTNAPQVDKGSLKYREDLQVLIQDLAMKDHVIWLDRYLSKTELLDHMMAADIGLLTYTRPYQSSSGILPQMLGCGRLAISTEFGYAISIAKEVNGLFLVEMNNPDALVEKITEITQSRESMLEIMRTNYIASRNWTWSKASERYMTVFSSVTAINS